MPESGTGLAPAGRGGPSIGFWTRTTMSPGGTRLPEGVAPDTGSAAVTALAPTTAAPAPAPAGRSPHGRRHTFFRAVRAILPVFLLGLTAWNATRSPALTEARDAERRGDFANALRCALEHLARRPWSREADLIVARSFSRLDFADQAEPHYWRALLLSAEDEHYRAYGLVRANLRDRAIEAYQQILKRRPADVTALRMEAGVLLSQRRWHDVLTVARRLIAIPPVPAPFYVPITAAGGHWSLRRTEDASAPAIGYTLEGLVHHERANTAADALESSVQKNETAAAVAAFERVLALDPDLRAVPLERSSFWAYLTDDLRRLGRDADARRYQEKAHGLQSDDTQGRGGL
jgi:tetratricopeptide (TPR) repeat protein